MLSEVRVNVKLDRCSSSNFHTHTRKNTHKKTHQNIHTKSTSYVPVRGGELEGRHRETVSLLGLGMLLQAH